MEVAFQSSITFLEWFGMDLSPQTLLKCAILTVLLFGLLLVIAVLYRGELQNRDIVAVLKEYSDDNSQPDELVFARRTLDIKTETTASDVAIYVTSAAIAEGDFGVFPERHTRIAKKIAECQKSEMQRAMRHATPFWEQVPIIKHLVKLPVQPYDVSNGETAVRLSFPINPIYLLTAHPDREVKTSAWLTLLTSFFAVVMQIFFGGGQSAARDTVERPAIVRVAPPQG